MNDKRVLIIDDEPLIRHAMADYLAECEYQTATASDGAEGLARARAESFDIVLVDLRMPRVDGLEVIAHLKAEQPALPVVVVSGTGVLGDAIEAMRRGAWDYITKPIHDMDEVAVVIERVVDKARLIAERDRYQRELEQLNRSLEAEVARQTEGLRVQNRELAALNRVSYAISGPLDLDTMLNRALDAALVALEADGGAVRLLNSATHQLVLAATRGVPDAYRAAAPAIPLGEGLIGQVAQSGYPQIEHNLADDPWIASLAYSSEQKDGFRSYLCVPLRAWDEAETKHPIVGTLGILSRTKRRFEPHEVELLSAIGNQIGVAVARTQYAADLEKANAQLERANNELRRLDVLREQLIRNVAHELRTPMTMIRGYVELLAQGELEPEEQHMALNVTVRHVHTLTGLVESITTMQDLSSQPLRLKKIEPAELLDTACQMTAQRALSANIKLQNTCAPNLPFFSGDFGRLAQALHQLLDNACKFSPQASTVTITAQIVQDALHISVIDHGIGIPPEEHSRIFERFYQVDGSTTRRYGGTGLGLALAKQIVEAHGGAISLHSTHGEGCTVTVSLPLYTP